MKNFFGVGMIVALLLTSCGPKGTQVQIDPKPVPYDATGIWQVVAGATDLDTKYQEFTIGNWPIVMTDKATGDFRMTVTHNGITADLVSGNTVTGITRFAAFSDREDNIRYVICNGSFDKTKHSYYAAECVPENATPAQLEEWKTKGHRVTLKMNKQ